MKYNECVCVCVCMLWGECCSLRPDDSYPLLDSRPEEGGLDVKIVRGSKTTGNVRVGFSAKRKKKKRITGPSRYYMIFKKMLNHRFIAIRTGCSTDQITT